MFKATQIEITKDNILIFLNMFKPRLYRFYNQRKDRFKEMSMDLEDLYSEIIVLILEYIDDWNKHKRSVGKTNYYFIFRLRKGIDFKLADLFDSNYHKGFVGNSYKILEDMYDEDKITDNKDIAFICDSLSILKNNEITETDIRMLFEPYVKNEKELEIMTRVIYEGQSFRQVSEEMKIKRQNVFNAFERIIKNSRDKIKKEVKSLIDKDL